VNLSLDQLKIDPAKTSQKLENFIKSGMEDLHRSGAVVGLSGGIDSSLALSLAVAALGADKVLGLIMPERGIVNRTAKPMPSSMLESSAWQWEKSI